MTEDADPAADAQRILDAASKHQVDELRVLLRTGSANVQDPETGYSPLHAAIAALASKQNSNSSGAGGAAGTASRNPDGATNHANLKGEEDDNPEAGVSHDQAGDRAALEAAKKTVALLLQNGAIWNDLDRNGETPGCIAYRLGFKELYDMMVDAGFRAEILLNRLDEYEELSGGSDLTDDDEDMGDELQNDSMSETGDATKPEPNGIHEPHEDNAGTTGLARPSEEEEEPEEAPDPNHATIHNNQDDPNQAYLHSNLTFSPHRILDEEKNGVMMSWESEIMERTAALLCSTHFPTTTQDFDDTPSNQEKMDEDQHQQQKEAGDGEEREVRKGLRILNIGHGMGIVDDFLQSYDPAEHHIVEAHPAVLAKMREDGWIDNDDDDHDDDAPLGDHHDGGDGDSTSPSNPETTTKPSTPHPQASTKKKKKNVKIHKGTWQAVLPSLVQENVTFDVIFFDTFAEDYGAFKEFFREYVVALLEPDGGVWSFFNGLGADRRVCYDVYTKVRLIYLISFSHTYHGTGRIVRCMVVSC